MSDLERELEQELHRVLDPITALPIPARRQPEARRAARALLGGAGAALTVKVLTGVAVAAAAVTVAGAATTGSLNPADWGQQVTQQVADCKAQLADGQHGIGACVSSFASQHGSAAASAARQHGNGNGNGNAHAKDKNKSHPATPKSGSVPRGLDSEPADQAATHRTVTSTSHP